MENTKVPQMLENLFGRFFSAAEKVNKRARPAGPAGASVRPAVDTGFESTLKALAHQQDLVVAGNLHVLNVGKIKAKVGDKWPRLQKLIRMNIEKIIESNLGPADIMLNHSELNYVVIFPNDSEAVANRKLADISRQIIERIFGTEALMKGFGIETSAAAVGTSNMRGAGATVGNLLENLATVAVPAQYSWETIEREQGSTLALSMENDLMAQLSTLLDRISAGVQSIPSIADTQGFHGLLDDLNSQLDAALKLADRFLCQHPIDGAPTDESRENRQFMSDIRDMAGHLIAGLGEVRGQVTDDMFAHGSLGKTATVAHVQEAMKDMPIEGMHTLEIDPEADAHQTDDNLLAEFGEDADFMYFPVWDVNLEVVNTYRCSIGLASGGGVRELRQLLPTNCPAHMLERMDLVTAQKALNDIRLASSSEIVCAFNITLRQSLIQSPRTRAALAHMFRGLSPRERKLLVIEITDVPPGTWASRVAENAGFLRQFCRAVLVRLPAQFQGLDELKQGGVYAVGYHLPEIKGSETLRLQELERLVIHAERLGLATFVSGVDQISVAASAVGTGVRYIDGAAVGLPLDMPWGILPFALESIYSRLLSS